MKHITLTIILILSFSYTQDCVDLSDIDFGDCDMVLGVGWTATDCEYFSGCDWIVDGIDYSDMFFDTIAECEENCLSNILTCDEISEEYEYLHSDEFSQCEYDNECVAVWGDCDVGLGGCHYAVSESAYLQEDVDILVDLWVENECVSSVCDCMDLPFTVCSGNICNTAYCDTPNPAGCFETGCPENYRCVDYEVAGDCYSSACDCDENYGDWMCTGDCNGGTCFELGDVNHDEIINVLDVIHAINLILNNEFNDLADMNDDGMIDVLDIVMLVNWILDGESVNDIQINSGTFFGMCGGYCLFELYIDNGAALFTASSWVEGDPEYPDLTFEDYLSEQSWQQLTNLIDFEYFLSLDDIYGCPDCNDGGVEWIEIVYDGISKKVIFEFVTEVEGIEELTLQLRELRNYYWDQVSP